MRRLVATALALLFSSACASAPPPEAPRTAPPVTEAEATPEAEPSSTTDPSGSAEAVPSEAQPETPEAEPQPEPTTDTDTAEGAEAVVRAAPDRWWYATVAAGVPGAAIDEAYELLADREPAREIVVAVIDGGVDTDHEDLDDVLWSNPGEVPGNDTDDDGNGYTDDVHGWSFIGGPSGESVHYDTFELTRVHAACLGEPAGNGTPPPEPAVCAEVAEAFPAERAEMTELANQIGQIEQIYPIVLNILRGGLGAEPTLEAVSALEPSNPQLAQARDFYLQLTAAGIDEAVIAREGESIRGRLNYGLDLGFDPRPIVGDDYADASERHYGSPDVEGPDPSHGTSVASVVAAERGNGIGLDGAGDGIRIMPVRAVPNGDERDKDVANAIRYAVDNGAHVINMSFGKDYSPRKDVVDEAIRYAEEHGVLLVHASGNDGEDLGVHASFPDHRHEDPSLPELWIEVGASAWQGPDSLAASFTNYGTDKVDLFAPGVAILAAAPDNDYRPSDGTSVAAPIVSGIAGMLMAYFPGLSASEVRTILLETASDFRTTRVARPGAPGEAVAFGELSATGGVVNAAAAVTRALR